MKNESLKKTWANNLKLRKKHSKIVKKALKKKYPNGVSGETASNWQGGLTQQRFSKRVKMGSPAFRKK